MAIVIFIFLELFRLNR